MLILLIVIILMLSAFDDWRNGYQTGTILKYNNTRRELIAAFNCDKTRASTESRDYAGYEGAQKTQARGEATSQHIEGIEPE